MLGSLSLDLEQVCSHAKDAMDRDLLSNPERRYAEVGHLGELVLQLEESLDRLPQNTDVCEYSAGQLLWRSYSISAKTLRTPLMSPSTFSSVRSSKRPWSARFRTSIQTDTSF